MVSSRRIPRWLPLLFGAISLGCGGSTDAPTPRRTVQFVGFDANPQLVAALASGDLKGVVLQNPIAMGSIGVRTLIEHLHGAKVAKVVTTGELLATPENRETPEVSERLNPKKVDHGAASAAPKSDQKVVRIMVIPKGTSHEFWKSIHAGALQAAEELGGVEILWQGPAVQDDVEEQKRIIQNAVASKVDGIVLAPADSRALVGVVEDAAGKGVPTVIIDSALESEKIVAFVATDNHHGGVLAGERLAELLAGKGEIILLRYPPGSAATRERERGFEEAIAKHPGISYLSKDQDSGPDAESARAASRNLVSRYRGEVDGIFCPNESSTQGMLGALREAGILGAGSR